MPYQDLTTNQHVTFKGGQMIIPGAGGVDIQVNIQSNVYVIRIEPTGASGYRFHYTQQELIPNGEKIYTCTFDDATFGESADGTENGTLKAGLVEIYDPAGSFQEWTLSGIGISDILDIKPDQPTYRQQLAVKLHHRSHPETWKAAISYHPTSQNGYHLVQTIHTGMTHYLRIVPS